MTNTEHTDTDRSGSPRTLFARRFAELYEAAGNPTLRRVATAADTRMRAAHGNRPGGASAQRISDWKAGRNVPARFESLLPVVLTLIDLARKHTAALPRELADPKEWQRLWQAATTWNPEEDTEAACPYPGLTSYGPENRDLFFGRTRATAELTDLVRTATGIVAVIGASGAGKSSLLAAGLAPALTDWEVSTLTPGAHPLHAVLQAISARTQEASPAIDLAPDVPTTSAAPDPAIPDTIRVALAPRAEQPRRLLVIDQFEELFTTCDSERDREQLLDILDRCATRADDPVAVVVALRADFYAQCLNYQILQHTLEQRGYLLGPMRPAELAQAISGPARTAGLELEPGLEELVITELCGAGDHHGRRTYDPGALPLLSHVMAATWQHREGRRLTVTGYRKVGGVVGSVAETAEYAWNELTSDQREAAQRILLGLVTVGQDAHDTRRTAQRAELSERAGNPEAATAALELLAGTRLISLDADSVRLTHEIVLTAWPRLRHWIDEDRVGYLVRQRVETDAAEWAAQERDPSLLYGGTRLHTALEHTDPPPVGPLAAEFLAAATASRRRLRRRGTRTRALLVLLGVTVLLAGFTAYTQSRLAEQRRADQDFATVVAQADRLRTTDPSLAAQLYLVARQLRPSDPGVRIRLLQTQEMPLATANRGHERSIGQLVHRSDAVLASVGLEGSLRLWDVAEPHHPKQLGSAIAKVRSVTFSANGMLMATDTDSGRTRIWDVSSPAAPRELAVLPQTTDSSAQTVFVGGDKLLATATSTQLTLWDISNPSDPKPGPPYEFHSTSQTARVSPKLRADAAGHRLAITRDTAGTPTTSSIQLLGIDGGNVPRVLAERIDMPETALHDMALSPDGSVLAVAAASDLPLSITNGKAILQLWSLADPTRPQRLGNPLASAVNQLTRLSFSPNGHQLAAAANEGLTLWNVTEPAAPALISNALSSGDDSCRIGDSIYPCAGSPSAFVFAPDGRTIFAGAASGDIRTWSLPPAILAGHAGSVTAADSDANGDRLVVVSGDGRVTLWDIRNRQRPMQTGTYRVSPALYSGDLSPDGNLLMLATRGLDGNVIQVLDLTDPARIRPAADWQSVLGRWSSVRLSRDWRIMAATGPGGDIQLWDVSDRTHPSPAGSPLVAGKTDYVDLTFGSDHRTLYTQRRVGDELFVDRWDITDVNRPRRFELLHELEPGVVDRAVFTPDGQTMILIVYEKIRAWDIEDPANPRPLGASLTFHSQTIGSITFSGDNRTALSTGTDGTVQLWDFANPARPLRIGGPLLEPGENNWSTKFLPAGNSAIGTSSDGRADLWDLDEQHAVDRICAITGSMWTEELWKRYLPQLPYAPPCR